ncbi:hypothetical protein GCM10010441_66500 [Kitasatospora paracochleata]|uniref:PH (Pleckstrin Homology) domain-containing protein n=1 Tax=Kitasatospora paracochleata TaxID=58354 RepID=A0ABT1J0W4_9ACTN|nr:hypothetical protein [Kitasatospora paracochleata]MCP2310783.1 hypothetical protein [Kitasatospora paracochleata]
MADGTTNRPELVISGRGATTRFDGSRLRIVRGRTTWTVPVQAVRSAAATSDGGVRVELTGHLSGAVHGLGEAFELAAANERAARAFLERLTAALAGVRPAEDGHALVRVEREQALPPAEANPLVQRAVVIGFLLLAYGTLLYLLAKVSPLDPATAQNDMVSGGPLALGGGIVLWRVGRRLRSMWLLRRRGIGVVGEVTGYVKIWTKGGHLWEFSKMSFTTIDGRRMKDVHSVVTVWGLSDAAVTGRPVELSYDPERPTRASRALTPGFVVRTLVLAAAGAIPLWESARFLVPNLP